MLNFVKLALIGAMALLLASTPSSAIDEYGIRCNPGGGQLPRDGVICFAFRPGTKASDFGSYKGQGYPSYAYVAANGRGMAVDCPNKDPRTDENGDIVMFRETRPGAYASYLILKGQAQSGKHRCCYASWQNGDEQLHKWCPDMAPLQI